MRIVDKKQDMLYGRVKVLCWVLTCQKNLYTRAIHVNSTWGKRCNKVITSLHRLV